VFDPLLSPRDARRAGRQLEASTTAGAVSHRAYAQGSRRRRRTSARRVISSATRALRNKEPGSFRVERAAGSRRKATRAERRGSACLRATGPQRERDDDPRAARAAAAASARVGQEVDDACLPLGLDDAVPWPCRFWFACSRVLAGGRKRKRRIICLRNWQFEAAAATPTSPSPVKNAGVSFTD
jgi:hypothetical protein